MRTPEEERRINALLYQWDRITAQLRHLGVRVPPRDVAKGVLVTELKFRAVNSSKKWTVQDRAVLNDLSLTTIEAALILGRSYDAVRMARKQVLGYSGMLSPDRHYVCRLCGRDGARGFFPSGDPTAPEWQCANSRRCADRQRRRHRDSGAAAQP